MYRLTLVLVAMLFLLPGCTRAAEDEPGVGAAMVRIETIEVRGTVLGGVVLLWAEKKAIPIFVDGTVAESIAAALAGAKLARPLSHDLMHTILAAYDGRVSRVVITLKGSTFYADLTVLMSGTTKVFDSRSSDAIALAVHFNAPVLVSRALLDEAGKALDEKPGDSRGMRL